MTAGERLIANDGYEVCLFPLEYMNISQDEGGSYSHQNTYNIDFLGWDENGRVYNCPFYAPVSLVCVSNNSDAEHTRIYQSQQKVHLANGNLDYLTIQFTHDDNPIYNVGDLITQGTLLGRTGTAGNTTGDHVHSCCGQGTYQGLTQRTGGRWDLTNRIHYYDATYVNNTVIINGFNHNWKTYTGPVENAKRNKFPFVLYANKLRQKMLKKI